MELVEETEQPPPVVGMRDKVRHQSDADRRSAPKHGITVNFAGEPVERDCPQLRIADPEGQQFADAVSGLIARERDPGGWPLVLALLGVGAARLHGKLPCRYSVHLAKGANGGRLALEPFECAIDFEPGLEQRI